jgi:hypothetical protein
LPEVWKASSKKQAGTRAGTTVHFLCAFKGYSLQESIY